MKPFPTRLAAGAAESGAVLKTWLEHLVPLSLAGFPVLMGVVSGAASGMLLLLFLIGLVSTRGCWSRLLTVEKRLLGWLLLITGFALISTLLSDDVHNGFRRFEKILRFALLVPIYLIIRSRIGCCYKAFAMGLAFAGPVMSVASFVTLIEGRAEGAYNSILFGDFGALIGSCALALSLLDRSLGRYWRAGLLFSASCAFYACFLSLTRGAWLVIPLSVLSVALIKLWELSRVQRWIGSAVFLVIALGASVWFSQQPQVQSRTSQAVEQLALVWDGKFEGSVGYRILLWKAAVEHWKQSPVLGSGLGDYSIDSLKLVEKDPQYAPIKSLMGGEAHSLYFEHLATLGVAGLVLLIVAAFGAPGRAFVKLLKHGGRSRAISAAGLQVIFCGMVFGLSQNWLARSSITAAFLVFLAVFLACAFGTVESESRVEKAAVC